jgi:hypothetical protein
LLGGTALFIVPSILLGTNQSEKLSVKLKLEQLGPSAFTTYHLEREEAEDRADEVKSMLRKLGEGGGDESTLLSTVLFCSPSILIKKENDESMDSSWATRRVVSGVSPFRLNIGLTKYVVSSESVGSTRRVQIRCVPSLKVESRVYTSDLVAFCRGIFFNPYP